MPVDKGFAKAFTQRPSPRCVHFIQRQQRQTDELRKRDKHLRCPALLLMSA
jgi:hypothetical protein